MEDAQVRQESLQKGGKEGGGEEMGRGRELGEGGRRG